MKNNTLAGGKGWGKRLRKGEPSTYANFRWSVPDLDRIDKKAKQLGINRSQLIRYSVLEYGLKLKKTDLPTSAT